MNFFTASVGNNRPVVVITCAFVVVEVDCTVETINSCFEELVFGVEIRLEVFVKVTGIERWAAVSLNDNADDV